MTKAQQVYERVEALVAAGTKKADAFNQVADELGQPFNSIRGAYYTHTRTLGGTPRRRGAAAAPPDPVEAAVGVLTRAIEQIDENIEAAKTRADDAAAEYKRLRESAATDKAALQARVDALRADPA